VRTKKLHQILGHYGPEAQKKKSIEELSELITLLAREQTGRVKKEELIEEIADSYNMLDQMVMIYGIKEEVKAIRKAKIERTLDHINEVDCGYINAIPEVKAKTRYPCENWKETLEARPK
jgi:Ca2+-binding EF-hand superfamily protein